MIKEPMGPERHLELVRKVASLRATGHGRLCAYTRQALDLLDECLDAIDVSNPCAECGQPAYSDKGMCLEHLIEQDEVIASVADDVREGTSYTLKESPHHRGKAWNEG